MEVLRSQHCLANRIASYGFRECATLAFFMKYICECPPGPADFFYMRRKLRDCLERHDDGSSWFTDLRAIASEIDKISAETR